MSLTFDHATHTYYVDGVVVPGVTRVLEAGGFYDFGGADVATLAAARERGTTVHRLTELDDKDDLVEESIDDSLRGYVEAWRRFKVETGYHPVSHEQRVYHRHLRYAGTLDSSGVLQDQWALIDKKTGQAQRATGPQTAAYLAALQQTGPLDFLRADWQRYGCYLQPDGRYNLIHYDDRNDLNVFLAALSIWNWKGKS